MDTARKAIGIVRVSQVNGREGESFASPGEQRERIEAACERDGLELLSVVSELDVSGGTPLAARAGLLSAVQAVEAGDADVIVAAYFDRLVRSLKVQGELVERVEAAGGQVLAVDIGQVTNGNASQWLSGTLLGAVAEYARRTAKERSGEAVARAVARGVATWPGATLGYTRGEDGRHVVDPATEPVVVEAFKMRAAGATVDAVRAYLAAHGAELGYTSVVRLLRSRTVLGEIHSGANVNLNAHEAIVDVELWRAVQRASVTGGRRPTSDRLLARLGVLRCATCGGRLVVGVGGAKGYRTPMYKCPARGDDCARRVTIGAELVEGIVVDAVRAALADSEGRAQAATHANEAAQALAQAQAALDAAFRAFAGYEDETAARDRLAELRAARDDAQAAVDQLGGSSAAVTARGWDDRLTLHEKRALIRAVVERVDVAPGRGAARVSVELFGE
jgi:site-specific DNA recombinase